MKAIRWIAAGTGVATTVAALSFVAVIQTQAARESHEAKPLVWVPPSDLPTPEPVKIAALPGTTAKKPASEPPGIVNGTGVPTGPLARALYSLNIRQRAVFITIDDGWTRDPQVLDLVKKTQVPLSLFLTDRPAEGDVRYFRALQHAGATIENHTVDHARLTNLSYMHQRAEICDVQSRYNSLFGQRPTLFRPPYGAFNGSTLRAVNDCGLGASVNWDATMGGGVLLTYGGRKLQAGDIILMHFKPTLYKDLLQIFREIRAQHLGVGRLEDFLRFKRLTVKPPPSPSPTKSPTPSPSPSPSHSPTPSPSPSPPILPTPSASKPRR